VMNFFICS